MKKKLAVVLALTMAFGMSATAFAAGSGKETVDKDSSAVFDVTAKYSDSTTTENVFSVDIAWDDMTFTYNESGSRVWNPDTHTYTENTTAQWDKTTADFRVTNHSNAAVYISLRYEDAGDSGVTGTLSDENFTLDAGVEGDYENAAMKTATLSISGTPNDTVSAEGIKVGTITVSISETP